MNIGGPIAWKTALLTLTAICTGAISFAQQPPKPTPHVLFVVFQQDLENPIASSVKLAQKFVENGYLCSFITDQSSAPTLRNAVKGKMAADIIAVATRAETLGQIEKWRDAHFDATSSTAPFGFVVFVGHGENRRGPTFSKDYLFIRSNGEEAICIQEVAQEFGKRAVPIIFIVDMCRTEVVDPNDESLANPSDEDYRRRPNSVVSPYDALIAKNKIDVFGGKKRPVSPVLTFWATQPGKATFDSGDFLSALVVGMERMEREFTARHWRMQSAMPVPDPLIPLERFTDLSIFTLYNFAFNYLQMTNQLQPNFTHGLVDTSMICASTDKAFRHSPPALDLLSQWNAFAETDFKIRRVPDGLEIERPEGATVSKLSAVSFFDNVSIPWQGRKLAVEAQITSTTGNDRSNVGCLIIPGDNGTGVILSPKWRDSISLFKRQPSVSIVDLAGENDWLLKSLAISVPPAKDHLWPVGEKITISKITLLSTLGQSTVPVPPSDKIDLLVRWWPNELKSETESTVLTRFLSTKVNSQRLFSLSVKDSPAGSASGRGGSVYRPPFATKGRSKLRVNVESMSAVETPNGKPAVHIVVMSDESLLYATIDKKGVSEFPFQIDGYTNHVSIITQNLQEVQFSELSVVTK